MYFVSFETSTKIFSLAVSRDEKVLRFRNLKTASVLEDCILPALDKILKSAGVKFNQLDGFAIAQGPGSFTSLRVGLATVKALAMGTGKPVVGIPTMDIIAHGVQQVSIPASGPFNDICVIIDARRGNVYSCFYDSKSVRKSDYALTTLDDVLKEAKPNTLFVGDATGLYRNSLSKFLLSDEKYWYPQARVMAKLAFKRFRQKQYDDAASLLPLYLYPQDCQVAIPNNVIPANAGIK